MLKPSALSLLNHIAGLALLHRSLQEHTGARGNRTQIPQRFATRCALPLSSSMSWTDPPKNPLGTPQRIPCGKDLH